MVINESKREFGFKLLNYYANLMKDCSDSVDEDSKLYAFGLLLKQSGKELNELRQEV